MLHFPIQSARPARKSNLGCGAGCGLTVSCSDHARIVALQMTFQLLSANLIEILEGHFSWQAQYLLMLRGGARALYWTLHVRRGSIMSVNFSRQVQIW